MLEMLAASSSRSSKPAIFGAAPAPEEQQRRPLGSAREGDAVALEVAAAEMAQAAANLVAIERSIVALNEKGVRPDAAFSCLFGMQLQADWILSVQTHCHGEGMAARLEMA